MLHKVVIWAHWQHLYVDQWLPRCDAQTEKERASGRSPSARRKAMKQSRPQVEREDGVPECPLTKKGLDKEVGVLFQETSLEMQRWYTAMSFGGPPQRLIRPTPPDRGSFPLDHEGECKGVMTRYLECLQTRNGNGKKCKHISKEYLECRMERSLMDRDEWKNLGFHDDNAATKPLPLTERTKSNT
ncbi:Cytochrome c oxidase assembly protein cox19 [Coemansia sp. RSA 1933]|nr:Cytochrome c oxidase assembly protein cox19 [Coemansia sp. RSA 1933]